MTARHMLPILAAAALIAWGAHAAPTEAPASDFEYTRDGKNVTLTKYTGNASELVIPEKIDKNPVTELGESLFKGNTDLVRVSIPDTVTRIRNDVFSGCSNLESVKMSKNIKHTGGACFSGCGRLTEISFPKRLVVGGETFLDCDSLDTLITGDGTQLLKVRLDVREYTVPSSIRDVVRHAFRASRVERVVFENGTTSIRGWAFENCKNLISITLPQTLESLHDDKVFGRCPSLTEVIFLGNCPKTELPLFTGSPNVTVYYDPSTRGWKPDADGKWAEYGVPLVPLDKAKLAALKLPPPKPGTPQKPAAPANTRGAAAAPEEAPASDFEYTRDGKSVTLTKYTGNASELVIPEKIDKNPVTELGENLFKENTGLVRVSIPDTVMTIGKDAFAGCSNLESVKMSKNIRNIGWGCFWGCRSLTEISFPKRLEVGGWAFTRCDSLDTLITGDGEQLLRIGKDEREYTVPSSIREIAKYAFWASRVERVVFEKGTTSIRNGAFEECKNLISVTLPQTLESILENTAFKNCPSLTEVIFLGNCPRIENPQFDKSPDVTVYYNPSARGWKPDARGKWAGQGVPLVPLDKAKLAALKLPPPKPDTPQQPTAPAPTATAVAPAAAPDIRPPANTMPAAEFDALYAEKLPQFPPALQKLHAIFTNETAKIDLDRVRGHAAALEDYAAKLDKLPNVFAQKADVEGVKAAKEAKELAYRGEVDTRGIRPELAALSAAYAKRCAVADAKAADALALLAGKYINALNANVRDLLLKNDIQAAESYKLEADAADRARHAAQKIRN